MNVAPSQASLRCGVQGSQEHLPGPVTVGNPAIDCRSLRARKGGLTGRALAAGPGGAGAMRPRESAVNRLAAPP